MPGDKFLINLKARILKTAKPIMSKGKRHDRDKTFWKMTLILMNETLNLTIKLTIWDNLVHGLESKPYQLYNILKLQNLYIILIMNTIEQHLNMWHLYLIFFYLLTIIIMF